MANTPLPGSSFTWVSRDPKTGKVDVYTESNARHLEAALRRGETKATLLLPADGFIDDECLIVIVHFNQEGNHTQTTANGSGLRPVQQITGPPPLCVSLPALGDWPAIEHDLPDSAATSFKRVAWLHLDPVTGVLSPYSKLNAEILEAALRRKQTNQNIRIDLPGNRNVDAIVSLTLDSSVHCQKTGPGFREVKRVEVVASASEVEVPVYRRPCDGTIDSECFRLTHEDHGINNTLHQILTISSSLDGFMEEQDLPVDAFAKLDDLDRGLRQMGFDPSDLQALARRLKTEPYLQAVKVLSCGYAEERWQRCPVNEHLNNMMHVWKEQGFLVEHDEAGVFHPTDRLLDDLEGAYDNGLLAATCSRFGGSNLMRVAAAAAYLLMNPDIGGSE